MPLNPGTKLGPYEITAAIGAGGMGEVYCARDLRLERTVAIKVLPSHLSANRDLKQRFEREARAISSLQHPHICTLYDVGHQDGVDFLVMEFLEGETLAARLSKGPLPTDQLLKIGTKIADALDKAHRHGIVHRDLKPGNIMLTKSGAKLMDFGLAKPLAHPVAAVAGSAPSFTAAPTMSSPVSPLTTAGAIVGTIQYMSPEQVEGREADARSDIFCLGATLYEMASGKRAFEGKSQLSVASAILEKDPEPLSKFQPLAPPALEHAIRTCLAKDPENRWQTAHDLKLQLEWIVAAPARPAGDAAAPERHPARERIAWATAILAVFLAGVVVGWTLLSGRGKAAGPLVHAALVLPPSAALQQGFSPTFALSPDGRLLAYVGAGTSQLYLRPLDQPTASPIAGTEGAGYPFFSPDSRWIGFSASGQLKKISVTGGAPAVICGDVSNLRGAAWGDDDTIIYTPTFNAGLWRVPAAGGTPKQITSPQFDKREKTHRMPDILPGGQAVLLTVGTADTTSYDDARIELLVLATGERRVLIEGGMYARYVRTGHILYARGGTLLAAPFDVRRLQVTGPPVPVLKDVATEPHFGFADFAVSWDGLLIYPAGGPQLRNTSLLLVDRQGRAVPLSPIERPFGMASVSPDGLRLALHMNGATDEVWIYEIARGTLTRLAYGWDNQYPVWMPDSARVTFGSSRVGPDRLNLFSQPADGTGEAERLTDHPARQVAGSWSPDGKVLAFAESDPQTGQDIWLLPVGGDRKPQPFLKSRANEWAPRFSPDGRWLAYVSDESGRPEVYVRPVAGGGKWQISTGGAIAPLWGPQGREIFFSEGDRTMLASVAATSGFAASTPRLLFERQNFSITDIMPDGQHFVALRLVRPEPITQLQLVLNWFDELKPATAAK